MQRRPLGDSGLEVSVIGLGAWAMGGDVETWGHVDDRESTAAVHQALDCGINLIDTAPVYGHGHSEEIVGKAVQGRRHETLLATKCGLLFPEPKGQIPARCLTRDSVIQECEQSLRRLQTDIIDLYECHWPDPQTPVQETMDAYYEVARPTGLRYIGLRYINRLEIIPDQSLEGIFHIGFNIPEEFQSFPDPYHLQMQCIPIYDPTLQQPI